MVSGKFVDLTYREFLLIIRIRPRRFRQDRNADFGSVGPWIG